MNWTYYVIYKSDIILEIKRHVYFGQNACDEVQIVELCILWIECNLFEFVKNIYFQLNICSWIWIQKHYQSIKNQLNIGVAWLELAIFPMDEIYSWTFTYFRTIVL